MISISTKQIFSKELADSRLKAKEIGETSLKAFVERMDSPQFHKALKKHSIVKTTKMQSKGTRTKAQTLQTQEFLQRILAAKEMRRTIDYQEIFKHELSDFPVSLTVHGEINLPSNKSALGNVSIICNSTQNVIKLSSK